MSLGVALGIVDLEKSIFEVWPTFTRVYPLVGPYGGQSPNYTSANALVIKIMHNKFD